MILKSLVQLSHSSLFLHCNRFKIVNNYVICEKRLHSQKCNGFGLCLIISIFTDATSQTIEVILRRNGAKEAVFYHLSKLVIFCYLGWFINCLF